MNRLPLAFFLLGFGSAGFASPLGAPPAVASAAQGPVKVERFAFPGPVAGVVARIDLTDPRVQVEVALADGRVPDGPGPCLARLDTPSNAARRNDFTIAINASFFSVPTTRTVQGKTVTYFVGNGAIPEGWHLSGGRLQSRPAKDALRDVFIVDGDGKCSFQAGAQELPPGARYAVSGSGIVLQGGRVVARQDAPARHPRSAVGLSADGHFLLIVAVDGRQDHSRGVTLEELGGLMKHLGAHQALNLDGGGSTALVVKDQATGVFATVNQPSDTSISFPEVHLERPVADVIGIRVR
jgi:Phosphodiester glycosidase